MSRPHLVVTEKNNLPVLIIDREGSIGLGLYAKLKEHLQIVLVGGREPDHTHNLFFLPLRDHIPSIPKDHYTHIFLITDSEKDFTDLLPSCLEKAKEDKAKLIIVTSDYEVKNEIASTVLGSYTESVMVLVKDMFHNPVESKKPNPIEKLFYQAKVKKAIKLSHMGLHKLYPVEYEDVIVELLKLGFGGKYNTQLFYLYCKFPITELGIAHALQKVNPLIKVDFHDSETEKKTIEMQGGVFLLSDSYDLLNKLYTAYADFAVGSGIQYRKITQSFFEDIKIGDKFKHSKYNKKNSFSIVMPLISIIIFLFLVILLPFVVTVSSALQGKQFLYAAKDSLQRGDTSEARKKTLLASQAFIFAHKTNMVLNWEASLVGVSDTVFQLNEKLDVGESVAKEIERISLAVDYLKNVITGYSLHPLEDTRTAVSNFKQSLTASEELLQNNNIPIDLRREMGKQLSSIENFANVIEALPAVLSVDGKKTYAVLFQNNMELRPGGGFIGSYAMITMNKGKISDFTIHDVYDADGQLRGHIEPPFQIRRFLASPHWYLRDSNFDVDFLKNASQVAFFLQLETGQQIDGVIGLDLSFVKNILGAVGGVNVPTYNQTVTPNNFFLLTETHAEQNFFPGSTQKKDFLRSLLEAIQLKIANEKINYGTLFIQSAIAAKEKHMLFAFADKSSQDLFTVNNLSSSLWDARPVTDGHVNDFIGISEANFGINKVNYNIERSVDQRVVVNDIGDVSEQVAVTYINKSKPDGPRWVSGTYTNYLRFILPQNTSLIKVSINGQEQNIVPAIQDFSLFENKNFVPPVGLEVARQDEGGKTLYGLLLTIPPNSTKIITIVYVLPQKFSMNNLLQYFNLDYFKQPGTDQYAYNFSLTYPSSMKAVHVPPGFFNQGSQVVYSNLITGDQGGYISLSKK